MHTPWGSPGGECAGLEQGHCPRDPNPLGPGEAGPREGASVPEGLSVQAVSCQGEAEGAEEGAGGLRGDGEGPLLTLIFASLTTIERMG